MKASHLIFFLAVAILVAVVSVVPGRYIIEDRIDLTRAEFWRLGFGPVAMLFAVPIGSCIYCGIAWIIAGFPVVLLVAADHFQHI
ncbi:MAG: hypothetical protein V9H26_26720 [Verrucomicrobiota bacterium]